MKNILIFLFSLIAFLGYSQTVLDPAHGATSGFINIALQESIPLNGTDTYTATKAGVSYTTGYAYDFTFGNANTGTSPTINLNPGSGALGAISVRKYSAGSLISVAANDLKGTMRLRYDGTFFVLDGIGNITSGASGAASGDLSGTYPAPTVSKILNNTIPANASGVLTNNGSGTLTWGSTGVGSVTNVSSADGNATVATGTSTPVITIVSAPKLQTGRTIGITGDITYTSPSFDGSGNVTAASTYNGTVPVTKGGTNQTSLTAFAPLFGGTTSTGSVQSGTVGTSGQVLTSNGAGVLPTFQPAASGFSNPMTTLGDIIYENATPAAARLAGNTTATKQFLTQTGNGSISATPVWAAIVAGDVPTLNQNTTGNAATVTTIPTLSGDVSNSGNAITVTKINNTSLSGLSTGILKNTTGTGVPSIAVSNTDYQAPITFGTGALTALGVNVGSAGAFTTFNGAGGTPSSINLGNGTALPPTTGISGWPANSSGTLSNNGSGTLTWAPPGQLGFSTTATAAGTTTLTSTSNYYQYFTGTTIQTVQLPVVSTLVLGQSFEVTNLSTGTVTVTSSGTNTVVTLPAGSKAIVTCILITGTSAASWNYFIDTPNPMTAANDILYGGGLVNGVAQPTRIANGTTGQFLQAITGGPPSWTTPTFNSTGTTFNQNSFGGFTVTNSNAGTATSAGIQFTVVATAEGFIYSTPSNFSTAALANAMVFQTASTAKGFVWAPGGTVRMVMEATNNALRLGTREYIGSTSVFPTALLHLAAETATAASAPLKFTAPAALLTTPEAVTLGPSINGDYLNFTTTTGAKRRVVVAGTSGRFTAQTAANTSVATYTLGATDASYEVSANVLVTTSSAENFTVTVDYTDEGNTARTLTLNFQTIGGTIGTAVNFANGAVPYEGLATHLRCKASTAITIKTVGTFTGATYNAEGVIKQTQ